VHARRAAQGGHIQRVTVYPSDYGLERMAAEAAAGPQVGAGARLGPSPPAACGGAPPHVAPSGGGELRRSAGQPGASLAPCGLLWRAAAPLGETHGLPTCAPRASAQAIYSKPRKQQQGGSGSDADAGEGEGEDEEEEGGGGGELDKRRLIMYEKSKLR
jgi:hypothetical protein